MQSKILIDLLNLKINSKANDIYFRKPLRKCVFSKAEIL